MISLGKIQPFKVKDVFDNHSKIKQNKKKSIVSRILLFKKREICPIKLEFLSKNYEHVSLIHKTLKKNNKVKIE